jgi:hypothetical protein
MLMQSKPDIALVGPSVYAENQKALNMTIIAKMEANGKGEETYYVITKQNGPSGLKELEHKKLSGQVVHNKQYVYNVLFDKQLKNGSVELISQKRPLRSLKDVASGKMDAALVDQYVKASMKELSFAKDLKVIYQTNPVPAPVDVVMGNGKTKAKAIKKALVGLCKKPDGKELCKSLTISSIKKASGKDYKKLMYKYNR